MEEQKTEPKKKSKRSIILIICAAMALGIAIAGWCLLRQLHPEEAALRRQVVQTAENWLGANEADGSHQPIIDLYNTQEMLPRSYTVTYEDSWCATFASAVAMECGMTDIIPTECSCQQQIALFEALGCWEERDWYLPQVGDYIFYDWEGPLLGANTGWSDHVGIVAAVYGPVIKVIEGNKDDSVSYRYVFPGHPGIRGYGLPDYGKMA